MFQEIPLITLNTDWNEALSRITQYLENNDLRVVCSFNLQMDFPVNFNCSCPHHNSDECNCSMAVLLVYAPEKPPVSLLIHGHEEQISFMLAASHQQYRDHEVAELVRALLTSQEIFNTSGEVVTGAN